MKLSEKKKTQLYGTVSDKVMDARIQIKKLFQMHPSAVARQIDDILSDLGKDAPQAALNLFEPKPNRP